MFSKKNICSWVVIFSLIILSLLVGGCGKSDLEESGSTNVVQEKKIVDMSGKTVTIPGSIDKIMVACYGGAAQEIAVFGATDKIVAHPSKKKFPQLMKMYPALTGVPDAGSFDNINIEEVLKIKPDVVIESLFAAKGSKAIEEVGIPVVQVCTGLADIESLKKEFTMMGELLDQEKQAELLVAYWNKYLNLIQERSSKIPENEKKRVYYANKDLLYTEGTACWGHHFITMAGGINVAQEMEKREEVSYEQLILWNPDVIIIGNQMGNILTIENIKSKPQLATIKAVEEDNLFLCPIGAFWFDRPSPEAILGFIWLGKILYPETFVDIDLNAEIKGFYEKFYHYNLSDQELESFFELQKE